MSTPRAKYSECYMNNYLKKKTLNLLKELIYCTPVSKNPHVQKFSPKCWGKERSKLLPGSKPFNIQQCNGKKILSAND